ncbi:MAG TPA: cupin domain-containing protein [Dongiaceae bacterium]|jgi:quercetin dioxygenase-like cupin family protein
MQKAAAFPNLSPARMLGVATGLVLVAGLALYAANQPTRVSPAPATVMEASAARPTAHTLSTDALPHVAGKNITTMIVEFPPGGFSPPHHHGGSVTVYVLSGTIRSQLAGHPPMVYTAGQTFFEPPGIVHLLAENMSATEPARILAVFVADEGATLTTYHE